MSFLESIITALFCIVVVFVVLACLYFLIRLFSFTVRRLEPSEKKSE